VQHSKNPKGKWQILKLKSFSLAKLLEAAISQLISMDSLLKQA
jgi:hypothetical protein